MSNSEESAPKRSMAYVLLNISPGEENEVMSQLRNIPNVTETYQVYGVYDGVAKVEAESVAKIKYVVDTARQNIKGLKNTLTMMIVE